MTYGWKGGRGGPNGGARAVPSSSSSSLSHTVNTPVQSDPIRVTRNQPSQRRSLGSSMQPGMRASPPDSPPTDAGPPPPLNTWPAAWSEVRRDTNCPVTTGARATPEDERPSDGRAVGPRAPAAVPSEGSVSNEERPEWSDAAELIEARARVGPGV